MKTVTLKQGSPEWLEWRRAGIGGSDAPVVLGNSPYRTPRDLYFEKIGKPLPSEDGGKEYIFALGHQVEGLIRKQFQELTQVEMNPACLVHEKFDYVRASLDGFDPRLGVLEAKLVGKAVLEEARDGKIPDHHFAQLQHQMEVSGADLGQWFGHDGKKNGVLVEVRMDGEYIKRLLDLEHEFWERVKSGQEPPLSPRDYLFTEDPLLKELRDAKEHAENAQAYYDTLKQRAIEKHQHDRIAGQGVKIYKTIREGALSLKNVPEIKKILDLLDAEYLKQFRSKPVESWTVRLDQKKEAS